MKRDVVVRAALGLTVPFNLAAAFMFAFPASFLGALLGMPTEAPPLYRALVALFLTLFAGAYAWLLVQASISRPLLAFAATRPLLAFAAIGKSLAFFTFILLWLLRVGPVSAALASTGDAALAGVFAWWLFGWEKPRIA